MIRWQDVSALSRAATYMPAAIQSSRWDDGVVSESRHSGVASTVAHEHPVTSQINEGISAHTSSAISGSRVRKLPISIGSLTPFVCSAQRGDAPRTSAAVVGASLIFAGIAIGAGLPTTVPRVSLSAAATRVVPVAHQ